MSARTSRSWTMTPAQVINASARVFGITPDEVTGPSRAYPFIAARQMGMYLLRTHTRYSFASIAEAYNRDHTTVMNAVRSVARHVSEPATDVLLGAILAILANEELALRWGQAIHEQGRHLLSEGDTCPPVSDPAKPWEAA